MPRKTYVYFSTETYLYDEACEKQAHEFTLTSIYRQYADNKFTRAAKCDVREGCVF